MKRIFTLMLAGLFSGSVAIAAEENSTANTSDDAATVPIVSKQDLAWSGVYERSGKTVRAGEWMGIAGGSLMVLGGTAVLVGGVNVATGGLGAALGSEEGGERASQGAGMVVVGAVVGVAGFASFQVGPALMAGGTVRQAKAIRQVNPSAPRPWLGYSSWVPWAAGLVPSGASLLLQPTAYILAGLQKGRNRLHWDSRSAAQYEQNLKKIQVNLTPITIDGNRGVALVGSF
jgi:hypothetical protein